MRVLFWGTSEFAVPALRALLEEGHQVVAAITQPDRPAGRGRKLRQTPIRVAAEAEGIPVLTPERPRGEEFFSHLRSLAPDISVVAAYGHILTPEALAIPRLGSINVHGSLLPEWRGAAPVNWAIARGDEWTGVTIMQMSPGMDEGPILLQREIPIEEGDTASDLYLRLAELGAEALIETLVQLELGAIVPQEQEHELATYAPKLGRETARIDWSLPARQIANHIRAMDEHPGAWTLLEGEPVKLFAPRVEAEEAALGGGGAGDLPAASSSVPGRIVVADPTSGLLIETGDGMISIGELQPPGGRRMKAVEWLRGRRIPAGVSFE